MSLCMHGLMNVQNIRDVYIDAWINTADTNEQCWRQQILSKVYSLTCCAINQ